MEAASLTVRALQVSLERDDARGVLSVETQSPQQLALRVGVPQCARSILVKQDYVMQDEKKVDEAAESDESGQRALKLVFSLTTAMGKWDRYRRM